MIEDHTSLNKHLGACLKFLQKGCGGGGGKGTYMRKIWYSDKGSGTKCVRGTTKNYFQQFVIHW